MKCPRCGKENKEGVKICQYCGKRIHSKLLTELGEVLLLIVVFGTLIYLSIPNFLRYSGRSKNSEAKQNLGAIFTAYTSYHSDYNTYPSASFITLQGKDFNCLEAADWEPKGTIRYNYNCMNIEAFSPPTNDSPCPPGIVTSATKDSFTVAACGNVDNDTTVDVWTIDDAKHLRNVVDDVKL